MYLLRIHAGNRGNGFIFKETNQKTDKNIQSNINTHSRGWLNFSGILESSPGEIGLGGRERREGG